MQHELATLRERAAAAEQRATDLTSQFHRQQDQSEREISQLRENQATATAAMRQIKAHPKAKQNSFATRPGKS